MCILSDAPAYGVATPSRDASEEHGTGREWEPRQRGHDHDSHRTARRRTHWTHSWRQCRGQSPRPPWWRWPTPCRKRPGALRRRPAHASPSIDEIIADKDIDAVADRHAHRYACRPDRAGGARRARRCSAKSRSTSTSDRIRACLAVVKKSRQAADDRLQPPLRPELRRRAEAHPGRRDRRRRNRQRHLAGSRPAAGSSSERSGGLFRDMMIHDLDMARFLLGEEPVEVFALGSSLVDKAIGEAGDVDTAAVLLKTASRQDRADLELAARHLRLRPAHRGAWRQGHDPRRQRARDDRRARRRPRASAPIRCRTSSSSAMPRPIATSSTPSSTP